MSDEEFFNPGHGTWVDVNTRLPEDETKVLVWNKDSVDFAIYDNGVWFDYSEHLHHVTHWMPLPQAPSKQEKPKWVNLPSIDNHETITKRPLRRVIVSKAVWLDDHKRYELAVEGEATFHQFGVDYEEFENGPGNYSSAIIEWEDGKVEDVPVHHIQFINS